MHNFRSLVFTNACILLCFYCLSAFSTNERNFTLRSLPYVEERQAYQTHEFCGKVDNPCHGRGICEPDGKSYKCICHKNLYEGNDCKDKVKHCLSSPCQNGGTCLEAQGTFFCICTSSFQGATCERGLSGIERASVPFIWYQKEYKLTDISVFFVMVERLGADLTLEFSSGDGLKFKLNAKHFTYQSNVQEYAKTLTFVSNEIPASPRYVAVFENQYTQVKAYYMSFKFYNKELLLMSMELPLIIHPIWNKCAPEIILHGCGSSIEDSSKYFRAMKLTFTSQVSSGCTDSTLSYSWKVFKMTGEFPFPSKHSSIVMPVEADGINFIVDPFFFMNGDYALRLTVTETVKSDNSRTHYNAAICWIQIIRRPPVAVLVGGNERTVGWSQDFVIDGSASYEPDRPPEKSIYLKFDWKCWNVKNPTASESFCKGENVKLSYTVSKLKVPAKSLLPNEIYEFGVIAKANPRLKSTMAVQKIRVVQGKPPLLELKCIKNCEPKASPSKSLIYKVSCTSCEAEEKITYNWNMNPGAKNKKMSMDWNLDTERGRSTDLLIIPANCLVAGDVYTFMVIGLTSVEGSSTVTVEMSSEIEMGSCIVDPEEGVSTLDYFYVNCTGFKDSSDNEDASLLYQFYQELESRGNEDLSSSTLLYYDSSPVAEKLLLMPGISKNSYKTTLAVKVTNHLGLCVFYNMSVKVTPISQAVNPEQVIDEIEEMFLKVSGAFIGSVNDIISIGGISGAVQMIASLTEAMAGVTDSNLLERTTDMRNTMREDLVEILLQVPLLHAVAIKQTSSVLMKVLSPWGDEPLKQHQASGKEIISTTSASAKAAGQVIRNISYALSNESISEVQYFSSEDVERVANILILSGKIIIANQSEDLFQKDDDWEEGIVDSTGNVLKKNEDYPDYKELDVTFQVNIGNYRQASASFLDGLGQISRSLEFDLDIEENPIEIKNEDVIVWVKKVMPSQLSELKFGPSNTYSGVEISSNLVEKFQKNGFPFGLGLEVALFPSSPIWWQKGSSAPINTDVLYVNIRNLQTGDIVDVDMKKFASDEHNVNVFLKLHSYEKEVVEEKGSNAPSLSHNSSFKNDFDENELTVHQIQIPIGGSLIIHFEPPQNAEDKFLVVAQRNHRPEREDFVGDNVVELPHENSSLENDKYAILVIGSSKVEFPEFPQLFYFAVMPHPNNKPPNKEFSYKFYVHGISCNHFVFEVGQWSSEGCQVGPQTTYDGIHCMCSHLSLFGASLFVVPNKVDPFSDVKLFLTVRKNTVAVSFVCTILILYLILLFLARRKDLLEKRKNAVIFLQDNVQGDPYTYIVTVNTGNRRSSGTTANVYLQLQGTGGFSRIHKLLGSGQKILKTGGEDWFIILTPYSLGELLTVKLWTDNTGRKPAWYCSQIVVRELDGMEVVGAWIFLVCRWLTVAGMSLVDHSFGTLPCCRVKVASARELRKWRYMLKETVSINLRNKHLWFSIFTRSSTSPFTSSQRLSVAVCYLLSTMLASLMFYGIPKGGPGDQLDVGEFKIATREVLISVQSIFISTIISLPAFILFQLSDPRDINASEMFCCKKKKHVQIANGQDILEEARSTIENEDMNKQDSSEKSRSRDIEKGNKFLLPNWCRIIAWSLCISAILISSYFVCLYGLSFGKVKSLRWITSILLSIFQSILIIQPIKILLMAAIESYMKKIQAPNMVDLRRIERFDEINKELEEGRAGQNIVDQERVNDGQPAVACSPLSIAEANVLGRKEIQWKEKSTYAGDILALVIYIVSLHIIAYGAGDSLAWNNAHVWEEILVKGLHNQEKPGPNLDAIVKKQDLLNYLNNTVLPGLHAHVGYNGNPLPEDEGWTANLPSKLLGAPRLRQIRVQSAPCKLTDELEDWASERICLPPFEDRTEDISSYDIGWRPASNLIDPKTKALSLWTYYTAGEAKALPVRGELQTYPGDGYPMDLGRNLNNSRRAIQYLWDAGWVDRFTKALFLEFTAYNADRNLFSTVTILIERSPIGEFVTSNQIITSRLLVIHFGEKKWATISHAIFIIAVLFFFLRLCHRMYLSKMYRSSENPEYPPGAEEKPPSKLERILKILIKPHSKGTEESPSKWKQIKNVFKSNSVEFSEQSSSTELGLKGLLGHHKIGEIVDPKLLTSTPAYPLCPLTPPSYLEWFLAILSFVIVIAYILRSKAVHGPIQRLDEGAAANERHKFFSLIKGIHWDMIFKYALAIAVCIATTALWRMLPSFRLLPEKALLRSVHGDIPSMVAAYGIVLLAVGFSAYCSSILGSLTRGFSTLERSLSNLAIWPLGVQPNEEYFEVGHFASFLYFIFVFGCTIYIINLFLTIIMADFVITHKKMKSSPEGNLNEFGLYWFLRELWCRYLPHSVQKFISEKISKMEDKRKEKGSYEKDKDTVEEKEAKTDENELKIMKEESTVEEVKESTFGESKKRFTIRDLLRLRGEDSILEPKYDELCCKVVNSKAFKKDETLTVIQCGIIGHLAVLWKIEKSRNQNADLSSFQENLELCK